MNVMIGIVIVNYKTEERVVQYVCEELSKITLKHKIVIVNNSCTDESNIYLKQKLNAEILNTNSSPDFESKLFILPQADNLGYAKGNNKGAEFLIANYNPDFLVFSNCDLIFKDDDLVEKMVDKIKVLDDVGVIGPNIILPDGKEQSPCRFKKIWKGNIIPRMFYPFLTKKIRDNMLSTHVKYADEGYCDYLQGSFFFSKKQMLLLKQVCLIHILFFTAKNQSLPLE